ncbi:hypothetical protein ATANTOWER_006385 [Ataeniobius toweri]|uniref:Uncharacterized protein n=1 Tax=Ataeniobius toweri TaxID=208326 RepID=A0ABU7AFC8_9TELE|nr:hypothetical protein [Ataeniobius toweri]
MLFSSSTLPDSNQAHLLHLCVSALQLISFMPLTCFPAVICSSLACRRCQIFDSPVLLPHPWICLPEPASLASYSVSAPRPPSFGSSSCRQSDCCKCACRIISPDRLLLNHLLAQ